MNILLIGNGFDLAHGLPTKYTDFLIFCKMILKFIESNEILIPSNNENKNAEKWINDGKSVSFIDLGKLNTIFINECPTELSERDKDVYFNIFNNYLIPMFYGKDINYKLIKELLYLINRNFWVIYFLDNPMYQKENWIDFESEISQVIQSLDNDMQALGGERLSLDDIIHKLSNKSLKEKYSRYIETIQSIDMLITDTYTAKGITYREVRDELLIDLNKLIRAFEIYLASYVENIEIQKRSPDIEFVYFDFLLSFNYTNTYLELYKAVSKEDIIGKHQCDFIHGKTDINNSIESNNMVLGIDEYLGKKKRNKQVEFIVFKKYFQRIHKGTGCKYKEWTTNIKKDSKVKYNLYIFGHSLDVTDKDILREFILNENVHTVIYYRNLDQKGQQIANLVKVIGQDELIKRSGGGSAGTIEFKQQKGMRVINKNRLKQYEKFSG